jgi:polypeptide N-acetylgalactosaminyltransferase
MHGLLLAPPAQVVLEGAPLGRNLTDHRDPACAAAAFYDKNLELPDTTIILTVLPREAAGPVLRTVGSLLARTPPRLLREILLVDDTGGASQNGWIEAAEVLEYIAKALPKTRVVARDPAGRRGVLGARAHGVREAKGAAVTFMDSHSEVEAGWLEPMLGRIAMNKETVVFPKLDWENPGAWDTHKGGIGCTLGYLWSPLSEHEVAEQARDAAVRCAFFGRNLHSRMPLVPTPASFKRAGV